MQFGEKNLTIHRANSWWHNLQHPYMVTYEDMICQKTLTKHRMANFWWHNRQHSYTQAGRLLGKKPSESRPGSRGCLGPGGRGKQASLGGPGGPRPPAEKELNITIFKNFCKRHLGGPLQAHLLTSRIWSRSGMNLVDFFFNRLWECLSPLKITQPVVVLIWPSRSAGPQKQ